ncbi:sigma-54-dependent transcriptional regulator [Simiduia agarivorans]|uniref:sigma-54-dependent transcriptional regulator n=1 Tax=Simiduia agarivorans TaxID=447471 RepID=UPI00138AB122|nr:sigma 54-interacting transcriptional regulator [Simiduia agarivorans]
MQALTSAQANIERALDAQGLVAQSASMRQVLFHLYTAARRGVDVLLQGESGTGKEQLARLYHQFRRCDGDLATLDCTTLDEGLAGSELFGHERGAFTSAHRSRDGVIADADNGTLFLDEIGDLPLAIQPKLLRTIQERQYRRVGGNQWMTSTFGLVCASHVALESAVDAGNFRLDLYHRIAACVIMVPPLRERVEDIVPLAEHYFASRCGDGVSLSGPLRQWLCQYHYPGNVRELYQRLRLIQPEAGAAQACLSDMVMPCSIPERSATGDNWIHQSVSAGLGLDAIKERATREAKASALRLCDDSCKQAAQLLGVSERTLQLYKSELSG